MCERTFIACGGCDAPVMELRSVQVYDRRERLIESVDEDGDACGDGEYEDGESELVESYLECPQCGWTGSKSSLDLDCVPDDCDCDECIEPEPDDEGPDPDRMVMLVRENDSRKFNLHESAPPELRLLLSDRTIDRLPMPRWRAVELWTQHIEPVGAWPLKVDFDMYVSEQLVRELMIPCERDELPSVHPDQTEMEVPVGA